MGIARDYSCSATRRLSRGYVRVPAKCLVFGVVTFFVLFPNPGQFARHLSHLGDLDAMVEPDVPGLQPWVEEIRGQFSDTRAVGGVGGGASGEIRADPRDVQRAVEKFVYQKVKYGWDWDVWGSADYMPTVSEMFARGAEEEDGVIREDCDGRAVMAASMMRCLGYESSIVTDLRHVWVVTKKGEWMGPGRRKTIRSSSKGNQTSILATLSNVPVSFSYGVAVFPFWREMIILATAFGLLYHSRSSRRWVVVAAILLMQGLLFMKVHPISGAGVWKHWPAWVGVVHMSLGFAVLVVGSARARRSARLLG